MNDVFDGLIESSSVNKQNSITLTLPLTLRRKKFIDEFNWLVEKSGIISGINYLNKNRLSIEEVPEIYEKIEENKDQIVQSLLISLKELHFIYVSTMIRQLIKMGFKWEELDIIEKSLQASNKLYETESTREDEIRQYNIDRILEEIDVQLNNNQYSFITWMYQLKRFNALHDAKPLIDKRKNNIFTIIMDCISSLNPTVLSEFLNLLEEGDIQLPELYNFIQENKNRIIKSLLVRMKSGSFKYYLINKFLLSFYRIGIDWEELRVIKNSINVETKNLKESNKSNGEKQILDLAFYRFIHAIHNKDIPFITYHLLDYIRNGGDKERAKTVINDKKDIFKQILREYAIGLNLNSFNELARVLQRKLHIYWPELELSHYKDILLKNMIFGFKYGDLSRVSNDFRKLKDHRYNWPELDIIEKSLRAEKIIKEDEIDIGIVSLIKQALIKNNISSALTRCSILDVNQLQQFAHELKPLFEKRKPEVIKYLSSLVEKNKDYKKVIDKLVAIGIDWPELDTQILNKIGK